MSATNGSARAADDAADTPVPGASDVSLGRSSTIMALGTAVSRGLGFVRNILLVGAIGATGMAADTFDVANKLPNMLFAILAGGVLNAILVPQIVKAYRTKYAQEYIDKLLTFAGVMLLAITAVLTAGAAILVGFMASSQWSEGERALAITFALWCIPQLFFYGLYTLLGQVLNARKQFGPFMWAPVANNIVSIAGFSAFILIFGKYAVGGGVDLSDSWTGPKIALLAGTATLGVAAQALVLIWPLARSGFRFRVRLNPRGVGMRSAGRVALWTLAAVLLEQVGVIIMTRIASSAPTLGRHGLIDASVAGNAAYSQSLMIYLLPHSLVTVSIATALFTGLSAAAQAGNRAKVRTDLSHGVRTVGVFTILATAVLLVLSQPITKALIPTISAPAGVAVAQVLVAMSLGLVPLGAMVLMKWVFYAFEDGRTVFLIQVPMTLVLVGGSLMVMWLAPPRWWVVGIAASMALSNVAAVALRAGSLSRLLGGLDGARLARMHVRTFLAGGLSAGLGWGVLHLFGPLYDLTWLRAIVICAVVAPLMTGVYFSCLRAMHVREATTLIDSITHKVRRAR